MTSSSGQLALLREGRATVEDGLAYAGYLDKAAGGFFKAMLGGAAGEVIAAAYVRPANDYSFENVVFAECDGAVVGMVSGFSSEQCATFPAWPLKVRGAWSALRMQTVRCLCAPLFRALHRTEKGDFYLQALAVDRKLRGKGIGSLLMDAIEGRARAGGSARLCLDVSASNGDAVRLYERRGMAVVSQWPKRIPLPGLKLYRMARAL